MCFIYIYIHFEHYGLSLLDLTDVIFFTRSPFSVYIPFFASTLCMCVMYINVNLTDSFDDRRSQCRLI